MATSYYLTEGGNLYRSNVHSVDEYPERRARRNTIKALPKKCGGRDNMSYGPWHIVVDIMGTVAIVSLCATFWLQLWMM
ncbi:MAG: hypothetical protein IJX71_05710 [Oscillospiraceae bacterium]|nr:hypothetical protein [Oscillospiraceae bacterium]